MDSHDQFMSGYEQGYKDRYSGRPFSLHDGKAMAWMEGYEVGWTDAGAIVDWDTRKAAM